MEVSLSSLGLVSAAEQACSTWIQDCCIKDFRSEGDSGEDLEGCFCWRCCWRGDDLVLVSATIDMVDGDGKG